MSLKLMTSEQNTDSRDLREKLKLTCKQCYTSCRFWLNPAWWKEKSHTRWYCVTTLGRPTVFLELKLHIII